MAAGPESALAAAPTRGDDRRISANSFKLLTAKLKSRPAAVAMSPSQMVAQATLPATGIAQIAELLNNAMGDFSPRSMPSPAPGVPETADISTETDAEDEPFSDGTVASTSVNVINTEIAQSPRGLILPSFVPLPEFKPVEWPSQAAPAPEVQPAEVSVEPDVPTEFEPVADELPPDIILQPLPDFAPQLVLPAAQEEQVEAAGGDVVVEPVVQPESVTASEWLPEPFAADDFDGIALDADADLVEIVAPVEFVDPFAAAEAALAIEVDTPIGPDQQSAQLGELAARIDVPQEPIEVRADVQVEEQSETSSASASELDHGLGEEAKTATSEMAGRVVDAMIKTISTAIYAKPSAAERAAFLRDVATLVKEAEEAGEPLSPLYVSASDQISTATAAPAPIIIVTPSTPGPTAGSVTEVIAERLGPAPLLKASAATLPDDPFAQNTLPARLADPKPAETMDADEESGDLALTLLDMMSGGTGSLPHERTLAADTLLRILPRIPVKQLMSVVERVAIMETPPALLVAKLIRDTRPEVVGPLLERCSQITDQDLMNAAPDGDTAKLRMVARRRVMSTVLSDFLIGIGDPGVLLTLIRNPGAALSHEAFFKLADYATRHHALLAPLATRADLPPPVAFELFWHVPQELRRFIFSRFLTDSETLNKILRITLATHGNDGGDAMGEGKFPARETLENAIALAARFKRDEAALAFADMGGIARETASRILADQEGEPLTVLLKALGLSRAGFEEAISRLQLGESGLLRPDRNPDELQAIFEGLSFNKARILLTYWDWYMRKAGPYAPHN